MIVCRSPAQNTYPQANHTYRDHMTRCYLRADISQIYQYFYKTGEIIGYISPGWGPLCQMYEQNYIVWQCFLFYYRKAGQIIIF